MSGALVGNLLLFARLLRAAGVDLHHGRLLDAVGALEWIGLTSRADVRATLRALLVHRQDDLARFEAAFERFFQPRGAPAVAVPRFAPGARPRLAARPARGTPVTLDGEQEPVAVRASVAVGAYSPADVSRTRDFADFTAEELQAATALLAHLPWRLGARRTHRMRPAAHGAADLRAALRQAASRGGELIEIPMRRRRQAPRPIVILADVSGSMTRYSRLLLHFAYGVTRNARHVESFVFSTRLTRVTRRLARRDAERHLARIVDEVQDWGGGTRIGDALHTFNTRWARRVMRHGPIVILVSDGWDRGDPALVATELARLRRSCRRLIWLNPLLGSASYEPLTRGMQAALRYVDDFLPVHNLASLERLADHLQSFSQPVHGRPGPSTLVLRRVS